MLSACSCQLVSSCELLYVVLLSLVDAEASAILPLPAKNLEAFGPRLGFIASSGGNLVLLGDLGQMATL